jgi:hypothetical protein
MADAVYLSIALIFLLASLGFTLLCWRLMEK